jgi:hypothetical protein
MEMEAMEDEEETVEMFYVNALVREKEDEEQEGERPACYSGSKVS